jgi:hypothetical protein
MAYQAADHFTPDELEILAQLFTRQRLHGHYQVQYADGLTQVAVLHITMKPPLPAWVKVLAAARPEDVIPRSAPGPTR